VLQWGVLLTKGCLFPRCLLAALTSARASPLPLNEENPLALPRIGSHELRIGNHLYLMLRRNIRDGQEVRVLNPSGKLWTESQMSFHARMDPLRWSPVVHVNQVG
jgi:hypothetical protein